MGEENQMGDYAWYERNSGGKTHPVGRKRPNELGLYDMSGNVWEWVEDRWHENYEGAPDDGSAWTSGNSWLCVSRGGSWLYEPWSVRSASRNRSYPFDWDGGIGFRLAQDL